MIKEIVEFMELENNSKKFIDIMLDNRSLAKGLHIIVDKDTFKMKEFAYNDGSDDFKKFIKNYDLKKREYYCNYLDSNKNFDNSPSTGKNQIHSASPYAIFFRYKNNITITKRLLQIRKRLSETGYFNKIRNLTVNSHTINNLEIIENYIKKISTKNFIQIIGKEILEKLKNDDYIKVYFDYDINLIQNFYDEYSPQMSFNKKGLFEDKKKYTTSTEYNCPIIDENFEVGASEFLNTFADKKPFNKHLTRGRIYDGFSALFSGKVIQNLLLFEELLKLKIQVDKYERSIFPNPFPIFISNKDAINNEGNRIYFDLLGDNEPISYRKIIESVYQKIANGNEVNDLNFYLIFWANTKDGLRFYDVDYIDSFQFKLQDFKIENIFEFENFKDRTINNIFELEWKFFGKFFYTVNKAEEEKSHLLTKNYFTEKINVSNVENVPAMVSTKFYQYNKAIFDYIYKSKLEMINGYMFDDMCIPIIKEQLRLNDDWSKTYSIKEKLSIYISLHKNFHKGENLATEINTLQNKVRTLFENDETHLENDNEFAFASGQLIWYILSQSKSESKTHSLLDIFISKNKSDDYKAVIAQNIQKYSHAFKFYNNQGWFERLASEVMGYETEQKTIKSLVPLIMTGYFAKNIILSKISEQSEKNKSKKDNEDE